MVVIVNNHGSVTVIALDFEYNCSMNVVLIIDVYSL